jgi:hypothetical protein
LQNNCVNLLKNKIQSQSAGFMKKSCARGRFIALKFNKLSVLSCSICCWRSRAPLSATLDAATDFTVGVRTAADARFLTAAAVGVDVGVGLLLLEVRLGVGVPPNEEVRRAGEGV